LKGKGLLVNDDIDPPIILEKYESVHSYLFIPLPTINIQRKQIKNERNTHSNANLLNQPLRRARNSQRREEPTVPQFTLCNIVRARRTLCREKVWILEYLGNAENIRV
jgi:hypothetical protein